MPDFKKVLYNVRNYDYKGLIDKAKNAPDYTASFDPADAKQNSLMALCSYISWLVLIPFFLCKNSRFARFHVNQGLVLAVVESIAIVVLNILGSIPLIGIIFRLIRVLANIAFFAASVYGVITVLQGKAKELPFIGNIRVIK